MKWKLLCIAYIAAMPFPLKAQNVIAGFNAPDTACTGDEINITNTSTNATTYRWNFCAPNANQAPTAFNLGNFSGLLDQPAYMDIVKSGDDYFGFVTNYKSGNLVRLDFGNSLFNIPTVFNLGNFSGTLPSVAGNGGIQVVQNEGEWYAVIVAGYPPGGASPRLLIISFGTNIKNPSPAIKNWGNQGNMYDPRDLQLIRENNTWYGFTVNAESNSITQFNFTSSFENPPTGNNLGNLGNLAYPLGIAAVNDGGIWRLFITNGFDETRINGFYTITRLDFTNSLSGLPTASNFGNAGNSLQSPQDLAFLTTCDQISAFVLNGHPQYNSVIKLGFGNNYENLPSAGINHTAGNMDLPNCITPFQKVGNDFCAFAVNKNNSTITRISLSNCSNVNIATSDLEDPPAIQYSKPGSYIIELKADEGMPVSSGFCKEIYIVACYDSLIIQNDTTLCEGSPLRINTLPASTYEWSPATYLDDPTSAAPITTAPASIVYYVKSTVEGRAEPITDSIHITVKSKPRVSISNDTLICSGSPVHLQATGGTGYQWTPTTGLNDVNSANPVAVTAVDRLYKVKVSAAGNDCASEDSVKITVLPRPLFSVTGSTNICQGGQVTLTAAGGDEYRWTTNTPLPGVSSPTITASPSSSTTYTVNISENSCNYDTLININVTVHSVRELSSLPNAFTPNGDGKNDCFGIARWGDADVEQFMIYNRWGQMVFSTKNASECWDGTVNGIPQPGGGYIYKLRAATVCGLVSHKGMLTLIR